MNTWLGYKITISREWTQLERNPWLLSIYSHWRLFPYRVISATVNRTFRINTAKYNRFYIPENEISVVLYAGSSRTPLPSSRTFSIAVWSMTHFKRDLDCTAWFLVEQSSKLSHITLTDPTYVILTKNQIGTFYSGHRPYIDVSISYKCRKYISPVIIMTYYLEK